MTIDANHFLEGVKRDLLPGGLEMPVRRQTVMEYCVALAAAAQSGNQFVVNATQTAIEVGLLRLIPDKPTLADVEAAQQA